MLSLKQASAFKWNSDIYNTLIYFLKFNKFPDSITSSDFKKNIKHKSKFFKLHDNSLVTSLHNNSNLSTTPLQFKVVDPSTKDNVIQSFLDHESSQALNYKQLYDKIIKAQLIGISRDDVYTFLKNKPLHLHELRIPNNKPFVQSYRPMYPFEFWQIDLIDFRKLREQNRFPSDNSRMYSWILVVIDIFSKFIYLFPIEGNVIQFNQTMMNEITGIVNKIFLAGDIPKKIGCDNQFNNYSFIHLCHKFHIHTFFGLPRHPQTQGFVENKIKHIKSFLFLQNFPLLRYPRSYRILY